jgi:hypothetical protein
LEGDAALGLGFFEVVDRGEVAVGERRIREGPEVFGGLQLGRIRRQEEQVQVLGDVQLGTGVPPRAVEDQHDLLGGTGTDGAGEFGELDLEERDVDGGREVEEGLTRGGLDEANQIAPREAVLDRGDRTLAVEAPDLVQDRFQADAVLVGGPELDLGLGVGRGDRSDEGAELFLKAAWAAGSAETWRGRGLRRFPSRRTK